MPYYTYIICNYWVINKILFEYYLYFDFITPQIRNYAPI